MATSPGSGPILAVCDEVALDALFEGAPVLKTLHDLVAPTLFPDDAECDTFLAAYRADRQRDLASRVAR